MKTNLPIGTKAHVTDKPKIEAIKISDDEWQSLRVYIPDAHMAEYLGIVPGRYNNYYTLNE